MSYTLLIIDDDEDIRIILQSVLSEISNIEILEAVDATSAREVILSQKIDGIVLDFTLPDTNGEELLKELKASDSTKLIDIVMLSARDDADLGGKWLSIGAKAVFRKPFNPFELQAELRVHLGL